MRDHKFVEQLRNSLKFCAVKLIMRNGEEIIGTACLEHIAANAKPDFKELAETFITGSFDNEDSVVFMVISGENANSEVRSAGIEKIADYSIVEHGGKFYLGSGSSIQ